MEHDIGQVEACPALPPQQMIQRVGEIADGAVAAILPPGHLQQLPGLVYLPTPLFQKEVIIEDQIGVKGAVVSGRGHCHRDEGEEQDLEPGSLHGCSRITGPSAACSSISPEAGVLSRFKRLSRKAMLTRNDGRPRTSRARIQGRRLSIPADW